MFIGGGQACQMGGPWKSNVLCTCGLGLTCLQRKHTVHNSKLIFYGLQGHHITTQVETLRRSFSDASPKEFKSLMKNSFLPPPFQIHRLEGCKQSLLVKYRWIFRLKSTAGIQFFSTTTGSRKKKCSTYWSKGGFIYICLTSKRFLRDIYGASKDTKLAVFVWDVSWSITELPAKVWEGRGREHGLAVQTKATLQYLSSSLASERRDSSIPGIRTLYLAL